jgi:hypothetical protein
MKTESAKFVLRFSSETLIPLQSFIPGPKERKDFGAAAHTRRGRLKESKGSRKRGIVGVQTSHLELIQHFATRIV